MTNLQEVSSEVKQQDVLDNYFQRLLEEDLARSFLSEEDFDGDVLDVIEPPKKSWIDFPFQAIVCQIGKVEYAFPLHTVCAITRMQELSKPFTTKFNSTLGIFQHKEKSVCVVDTDAWLRGIKSDYKANKQDFCLVLDTKWGIVVPHAPVVRTLFPSRISWRGNQEKRSWVLGTVADSKCSILSGEKLGQAFDEYSHALHT